MATFLYRITPTRPDMLAGGPTEHETRTIARHAAYLDDLARDGRVLLAGRTLTEDESAFGIVIVDADSLAEARGVMENDPAVRDGVMEAALYPYRIAVVSDALAAESAGRD